MTYLNVFAAGNLLEVLLLLEGLVHLVVGHAEAAQAGLHGVVHLGEHHKLGHVGHADEVAVQLSGQAHRLWDLMAVCEPEPFGEAHRARTFRFHFSLTPFPSIVISSKSTEEKKNVL